MDAKNILNIQNTFGVDPRTIGNRHRSFWIQEQDSTELPNAYSGYLIVRTRDGGGNPISVRSTQYKNFVDCPEDSFDPTYRHYVYKPLK